MVTDTLGEQIAAPVVDKRALSEGAVEKIDIAPLFRGAIAITPLSDLLEMRQRLDKSERKDSVIRLAILAIDKEISKRG